MTTTPTPTPDTEPEPGSALPPPSRFDRVRTELVSGGTETPRRDEDVEVGGTPAGRAAAAAIVGLFVWLGFVNPWMLLFAVGIIVSVFLHETGHFVTARLTGMKATQFFLGFGPRLWSYRRGETEYGVRLLPLGAFVKILGMTRMDEVPIEDEGRTYRQQSYPKRMLVITAGSLMHMLIAIVLLFGVFVTKGRPDTMPGAEVGANPSGAALVAGIQAEDIIVAIDDVPVDGPDDMGTTIRTHQPGDAIDITLLRDGDEMTVNAVLGSNPDATSPNYETAFLGVGSSTVDVWTDVSLVEAATSSVTEVFPVAWQSTQGVVKVLNPLNIWEQLSDENAPIETRPSTVVGATQVSGARATRSVWPVCCTCSRPSTCSSVSSTSSRCCRSTAVMRRSRPTSASVRVAPVGATSPTSSG